MSSLPDDFDWITYIYLYDDLNDMNYTDAYYHYLGYGSKENRLYKFDLPYDFNWKDYYYFNKDIINNNECKNIIENLSINDSNINDSNIEKSNYDILYNFIYNENNNNSEKIKILEKYSKKHYTLWGKNEKRIYKFSK